ncbi:hypothetical protein ABK040_000367 [Willaertia magna]
MNELFSIDVLYEISKFISNLKDCYFFALTNKFIYINLLETDNYLFIEILNEIFKNKKIKLTNNLPNFIFHLENLIIVNSELNLLMKFTNLKKLQLFKIKTEYSLPNLNKLEKLTVKFSRQLHLNIFVNLKQLKVLNFHCCNLEDEFIKDLTNLQKLKISSLCPFTGKYLKEYKELKELNFTGLVKIKDDILNDLQNLTILKLTSCLNINGNFLKNLKNLKTLKIINCTSVCYAFHYIEKIINLKKLIVDSDKIDSSFVKNLFNLEYLKIRVDNIKDEDFYNLKNLKYLSLEGSGSVSNCFKYLNNLETLKCDLQLVNDLNSIKHIKKLYILKTNDNITDEDLQQFTNSLQIYCHSNISGKCFSYLNKLEKLEIVNNENITDEHLENLRNIKSLSLKNCPNIIYGKFLLNMNNLKELIADFPFEVEGVKERIRKGNTLKEIMEEEYKMFDELFVY